MFLYQFGFRKSHSTYTCMVLISFMGKVIESYVVGIFWDLSKAFDTVHHCILLKNVDFFDDRGFVLPYFKSYLDKRKQFVKYDGISSDIKCGVPQGSILDSLLFLIYINHLVNTCEQSLSVLFTHDRMYLNMVIISHQFSAA